MKKIIIFLLFRGRNELFLGENGIFGGEMMFSGEKIDIYRGYLIISWDEMINSEENR